MPNISGFIDSIGGLKIKDETAIQNTNITNQGIYRCREGETQNLPDELTGISILVSIIAFPESAYMIQFIFGLNVLKRYTRLKIDSTWISWQEF